MFTMASSGSCQHLEGTGRRACDSHPTTQGKQHNGCLFLTLALELNLLHEIKNLRVAEKEKQLPDQNLNVMPSPHCLSPCPRKKTYCTFKYLLTHMEGADLTFPGCFLLPVMAASVERCHPGTENRRKAEPTLPATSKLQFLQQLETLSNFQALPGMAHTKGEGRGKRKWAVPWAA